MVSQVLGASNFVEIDMLIQFCSLRFKDEQAYQRYLNNWEIVSIKVQCENKRLLQTAQSDRICHPIAGFIRRPETISDPFVVIASVRFKPGQRQGGFEQFGEIAKAVRVEEPETYTYIFSADTQDAGLMWNFERYTTEKFLREIHVARDDLKRNRVRQETTRQPGGLHHYYWKQIAEFQAGAELEP